MELPIELGILESSFSHLCFQDEGHMLLQNDVNTKYFVFARGLSSVNTIC